MQFDLTPDWQMIDNTEPITLTVDVAPQDGSATPIPVTNAFRRAPTWKELQASNGAYTGQDLVWLIPVTLLPAGLVPKAGDQIADVANNTWTALEVSEIALKSWWRLVTRNLVIAYNLRDTITIQQSAVTYDADGAAQRTWSNLYPNLVCRVQPQVADVTEARGLRGQQIACDIILSRQVVIDVRECRVVWADAAGALGTAGAVYYLDLEKYRQSQRIDELPIIEARLKLGSVPAIAPGSPGGVQSP